MPKHIWCSELELYNTNTSNNSCHAAFPRLVYLTNAALISCYMQGFTPVNIKMSSKFICLTTIFIPVYLPCVYLVIIVIRIKRNMHLSSPSPKYRMILVAHTNTLNTHTHTHTHTNTINSKLVMHETVDRMQKLHN